MKAVGHICQQKVQRAQTQNSKNIRGKDNKRVGSNGKNSGDRINRKHNVGKLDKNEHEKKWRKIAYAILLDAKFFTMKIIAYF